MARRVLTNSLVLLLPLSLFLPLSLPSLLPSPSPRKQKLYDVPNWVEERTKMHFPQAEAGWLDAASKGHIGDDAKTDEEQKALNDTIVGE
jgi:hypothetical protein